MRNFFNMVGGMFTIGSIVTAGPLFFSSENYSDQLNAQLGNHGVSLVLGAATLYGVSSLGKFSSTPYMMGAFAGIGMGVMELYGNYTGNDEKPVHVPPPSYSIERKTERIPSFGQTFIHAPRP